MKGGAKLSQGLSHEELEGPELGADGEDLTQPVTPRVVQEVEGLGAGGPGGAGVGPHVAPVVLVYARVQVGQVNYLGIVSKFELMSHLSLYLAEEVK